MNQSVVRLGLASFAALGVHALLFLSLTDTSVTTLPKVPFQIELLSRQATPQNIESTTKTQLDSKLDSKKFKQTHAIKTVADNKITMKAEDTIKSSMINIPIQSEMPKLETLTQAQVEKPPLKHVPSTVKLSPQVTFVPLNIQSTVLAQVDYPRLARRRGWQGAAELRFDITNEKVGEISIFASTGFDVLDQAAYQALASISDLPLSNGSYRLPVVFKLQ